MYNYYSLDIIPIILNRFKVKNIVISGLGEESTVNQILNYCDSNDASYVAIDSKNTFEKEFIQDYTLNVLPNLGGYGAIFLNDDPNWYTVYNELNIIRENNDEFPLVFICHNVFPHKRRDSYINPDIVPTEFRKEYSKKFKYGDVFIIDEFYHAIDENTLKNGVLTAIEDFIGENKSIGIMNIKLLNGITILYPKNNISYIRLGKLSEEIEGFQLEFDNLSDNIVENKLLSDYVSKLNISNDDLGIIENIMIELDYKERIIGDYENKIELQDSELNYKNSQIGGYDSKLSLKDAKIKNFESVLVNRENEINILNNNLQNANDEIDSLKEELSKKDDIFNNKEMEFDTKINESNFQISSLKSNLSQKEQMEKNLNNQLKMANDQIKRNEDEINKKEKVLFDKNKQILLKQKELNDKEESLNSIKRRYTGQLSKLDSKEYCISCYKEEISNNYSEIQYLKKNNLTRKLFSPLSYIYLLFKSNPNEVVLNFKLYKALKNSKCFDIGYYLTHNNDIQGSIWCKCFSPELHYVCNGFSENRKFNKKYFNRDSKKDLLEYIKKCS